MYTGYNNERPEKKKRNIIKMGFCFNMTIVVILGLGVIFQHEYESRRREKDGWYRDSELSFRIQNIEQEITLKRKTI